MDEAKLRGESNRADAADRLLKNDLLVAAWADTETALIQMWTESPPEDKDGRERIYSTIYGLRSVKKAIKRHIETGKLAKHELKNIEKGTKKRFS